MYAVRQRNIHDEERAKKYLQNEGPKVRRVRPLINLWFKGGKGNVDKIFFERI